MNQLEPVIVTPLLAKVKGIIGQGARILGNFSRQSDTIKLWLRNREVEFAVIATSSKRFGKEISYLEIQSFGKDFNYKLTIYSGETRTEPEINLLKLNQNYLEMDNYQLKQAEADNFIESFLASQTDRELLLLNLDKQGLRPSDYRFENPET